MTGAPDYATQAGGIFDGRGHSGVASELEVAAGASAGAFVRKLPAKHAAPVGTPCHNCATPLQGPWCHACGQSGEDFHRSIVRLAGEVVEGLLHFDGRLWRTLPDLIFRPDRLTRSYLEGHRAPQIPPLRLFLVVLLGIFLIGGLSSGSNSNRPATTTLKVNAHVKVVTVNTDLRTALNSLSPQQRAHLSDQLQVELGSDTPDRQATQWLRDRIKRTIDDPERFQLILEQWSERFAFLMLPISALMLSVLFVFQRRFFLFDHTIFSLHSLSAMGIALILTLGLQALIDDWALVFLLPAPLHLFLHLRGVYGTSVIGTLIRMALLFLGTCVAVGMLALGLIAVGLNGMNS